MKKIYNYLVFLVTLICFSSGCSNPFYITNKYKIIILKVINSAVDADNKVFNVKGTISVEFKNEPSKFEIDNMARDIGISVYIYNDEYRQYYLQTSLDMKGIYPHAFTLDKARISIPNNWIKFGSVCSADWEFSGEYPNYDVINMYTVEYYSFDLFAVSSNIYELSRLVKEQWRFEVNVLIRGFGVPNYQKSDNIPKHLFVSEPYGILRK